MTTTFRRPALAVMSVALALTLSLGTHVASVSASDARNGELHVIKNCNNYTGQAGSYCTITSSNLAEVPPGTRVFYDQAFGVPNPNPPGGMLDSNVLLYVGTGNWAVGRCTLDGNTNLGLCTFSDGVGPLTAFHAKLDASPASGTNNYHWDGPFSFNTHSD